MRIIKKLLIAALTIGGIAPVFAADAPQKREMRSAWVATVWRLDWPQNTITSTGNQTQIDRQKKDLITMLDSLSVNNMNCVNFQVRSRAEALYKSSYEPWSQEIVEERGMDPGYDPLQFCIDECHKRGMECHAWINPYRVESVAHQWDGTPRNYRDEHPDWLMDVTASDGNTACILNPGRPEVTQRICDIIREILQNYDVDGVLFDDYFYLSGTPNSMDADLYSAYTAGGGKLSQADWRRENVNGMIDAVYKTVKETKPWVRFGVSPAGIACTSGSVASKYGITPCPTGSDWQYSSIYSDPIAWVSRQSLDFISPQIYWTIGAGTDYEKACKWWSNVAAKWNRHFYSSHSISSLNLTSKSPAMSGIEEEIHAMASGQNSDTFAEYANEIRLNRKYTQNEAPGSIFYSVKYMYRNAPKFAHYLKNQVFNTPALIPAMTWQPVQNPGNPSNVTRAGNVLSWQGPENVRYTVYAVPTSVPEQNFAKEAECLLGVSYDKTFTVNQKYLSGYNFAVCTLDRYGNEYSPVFVGAATHTLSAPQLTYPADNETVEMPFDFAWNAVDGATSYIVEIARDAAMTQLLYTIPANATTAGTESMAGMPIDTRLFWRVRSCGNSCNDGISDTRAFTPRNLQIISPDKGQNAIALAPTIKWSIPERDITLQIANSDEFTDKTIVYTAQCTGGSHEVPRYTLASYTTYYVRALYVRNGIDCITEPVEFTTCEFTPAIPVLTTPVAGGVLHSNERITMLPVEGAKAIRIELSATSNFPPRSSYIQASPDMAAWCDTRTGGEITISNKTLSDGATYYVRVLARYNTAEGEQKTDFCTPVEFTYSADAGVNDITVDNILETGRQYFDLAGRAVDTPSFNDKGAWICRVQYGNGTSKTIKIVR